MKTVLPEKLKSGDKIAVIAPSRSMSLISEETKQIADERFKKLGLELVFGENIYESDDFNSSSIKSRIKDLHDAFADPEIKGILTVIGGFNANQLLRYIDWDIIIENPKIFCGFSDITVVNNSILQKTGLITYSGPHYSSFGQKLYFGYTLDYFKKCLMSEEHFEVTTSENWSDDLWFLNQNDRKLEENPGYLSINQGEAEGKIIGGNICTLNLIQGTEYFPEIDEDTVLFIEDDSMSDMSEFDRNLQSLIHLDFMKYVKGIVIGRFQKESKSSDDLISQVVKSKQELGNIPVIARADFGHTDPKFTFPVGGNCKISSGESSTITITKH